MKVPDFAVPVLSMFQPTFSTPTYHRILVLMLGAFLTTGRQTLDQLKVVRYRLRGKTIVQSTQVTSPMAEILQSLGIP